MMYDSFEVGVVGSIGLLDVGSIGFIDVVVTQSKLGSFIIVSLSDCIGSIMILLNVHFKQYYFSNFTWVKTKLKTKWYLLWYGGIKCKSSENL